MKLGSRDPLKPDANGPGKAPAPIASGLVIRRDRQAGPGRGTQSQAGPQASPGAGSTPGVPPAKGMPAAGAQPGHAPAKKGQAPAQARPGQAPKAPESASTRLARSQGSLAPFAAPRAEEPALALIESASIAVGFLVADVIAKKAPVRILRAQTASPGKFLVLFAGDVASVEEAYKAGMEAVGDSLLDELLLPHAHEAVLPALEGLTRESTLDSFAVIETFSFAAAIVGADVAVKAAPIGLIEVRPPVGLGGKSFVTLTGGLEDLQFAVEQALERIRPGGMLCRHVLIPNPHEDLHPFVF